MSKSIFMTRITLVAFCAFWAGAASLGSPQVPTKPGKKPSSTSQATKKTPVKKQPAKQASTAKTPAKATTSVKAPARPTAATRVALRQQTATNSQTGSRATATASATGGVRPGTNMTQGSPGTAQKGNQASQLPKVSDVRLRVSTTNDPSYPCGAMVMADVNFTISGPGTVFYRFDGPQGVNFAGGTEGSLSFSQAGQGGPSKGATFTRNTKGKFGFHVYVKESGGRQGPLIQSNTVPIDFKCAGGTASATQATTTAIAAGGVRPGTAQTQAPAGTVQELNQAGQQGGAGRAAGDVYMVRATVAPQIYTGPCPGIAHFVATVTANGPVHANYVWNWSDGSSGPQGTLNFASAGSQQVKFDWTEGQVGPAWGLLTVRTPRRPSGANSNKAVFNMRCGGGTAGQSQATATTTANATGGVRPGTNVTEAPPGTAQKASQAGKVTALTAKVTAVSLTPPAYSGPCPHPIRLVGTIAADGPGTVQYRWNVPWWLRTSGSVPPRWDPVTFSSAGTKDVIFNGEMTRTAPRAAYVELLAKPANAPDASSASGAHDLNVTCTSVAAGQGKVSTNSGASSPTAASSGSQATTSGSRGQSSQSAQGSQPAQGGGQVTNVAIIGTDPVQNYTGTCPAKFTIRFSVTTDGPADVRYVYVDSDHGQSPHEGVMKFTAAGTKELHPTVQRGQAGKLWEGWVQLKVLSPNPMETLKEVFSADCRGQ